MYQGFNGRFRQKFWSDAKVPVKYFHRRRDVEVVVIRNKKQSKNYLLFNVEIQQNPT